ncbi:AMP nucleosidase, partial [Escherichia coli]|nr:AMP nucleosidase [Escherichia coli]
MTQQASDIVADLERLYNASVDRLKAALNRYINDGTPPNPEDRIDGSFAYPELRLVYRGGEERGRPTPRRSFGRLVEEGEYRISVTRPAMFS